MADVMPVRTSTNPVEGINRCECGSVRTIHRARGKRAKFLYSICDSCGTNQQTGQYWQEKFNVHYATLADLHQAEQASQVVVCDAVTEPEPEPQPEPKPEPIQPESLPVPEPQQTKSETDTEPKLGAWKAILAGIILGGLTGGLITRI
ncbi:hypothetical protein ACUYOF_07515 [Photobacterium ganghwense]|uniref:hypothetical protein n=1 Tax=Photobacterium ganghwense TaxID=320778 RepID=UPI004055EDEA